LYPNEIAYDVRILALSQDTLVINEDTENDDFSQKVNSAKDQLLSDSSAEIPEATPVYD